MSQEDNEMNDEVVGDAIAEAIDAMGFDYVLTVLSDRLDKHIQAVKDSEPESVEYLDKLATNRKWMDLVLDKPEIYIWKYDHRHGQDTNLFVAQRGEKLPWAETLSGNFEPDMEERAEFEGPYNLMEMLTIKEAAIDAGNLNAYLQQVSAVKAE